MNDFYKAFIVAVLSLVVSLLSYRYQFRRSRLIDFKGRMRYLFTLIKETVNLTQHALDSIKEVTDTLQNNNLRMPLLPTTAYPIAKHLQDKVLTDDYFIAYINAYDSAIGAEKLFYDLKYNAVFIHVQHEQVIKMASDAVLRDNERRKNYIELYQKTSELIEALNTSGNATVIQYRTQIESIERTYITTKERNDNFGNIGEVQSKYVEPMLTLMAAPSVPNELLPLMLHLGNMYHLFKDIQYQNDHMRDELIELSLLMKDSLKIVQDVYDYLKSPQILNLIKPYTIEA